MLVRSLTAAAVPFARSGFRVLIDFSIPPTYVDTARTILKEVPFDFVLLRPSLRVCIERAASREEGAITDYAMLKNFYRALKRELATQFAITMLTRLHWRAESLTGLIRDSFGCFECLAVQHRFPAEK